MCSTSHDIPSEVEPRKTSFLSPIFCIAIILITTLATLWPVVKCDFTHMDDDETVAQNQHVYPASLGGIVHIWTHAAMGLYVPVTYTVWSVIGWISGPGDALAAHPQPDPALFHAANLLIHVIASLVVFAILRRMLCHDFAACLGALFFAIHPVQVEPVAWVSGLKDVLSGLFALIAICQYLAFVEAPTKGLERTLRYLVVLAAAGLAMLSKPSAMVLPLIMVILDFVVLRRSARQIARGVIPVLVVCLPCTIAAMVIQHPPRNVEFWQRPFVVLDSLSFYAIKLVWPLKLGANYGRRPTDALASQWIWFCWVIPLIVAVGLWLFRRQAPRVVAGVLIFVACALPTLGFVNTLYQDKSTVADHYLYLSMFGVALAIGAILVQFKSKPPWAAAILAAVACTALSFRQTSYWQNSYSLYQHATDVSPRSWAAHSGFAQALIEQKQLPEAEVQIRDAVEIFPSSRTYLSLGNILLLEGRPSDAVDPLQKALDLEPGIPGARLLLANAYLNSGRPRDAQRELEQVLQEHPDDERAANMLRAAQNASSP